MRWIDKIRSVFASGQQPLLSAALVGLISGAGVAVFEFVTRDLVFYRVLEAPLIVQAGALCLGLIASTLSLRYIGNRATGATADEYIRAFHEREADPQWRPFLARMTAGAAVLGSGGSLGYEGPSLYLGATVGAAAHRLRPRRFARSDHKVLMVAGAAAGVAAIFKAPTTGAIFALEVPYRDDTARHMLLPALIAAVTGYLSFVFIMGTEPLFAVEGSPSFQLRELGGAALLGVVCGIGARGYAALLMGAKRFAQSIPTTLAVGGASTVLIGLLWASNEVYGEPLSSGSGYRSLEWVTQPSRALWLVLALLGFRVVATTATLAGGGVGGLFIPLVVAGAITGEAMAIMIGDDTNLFPLIGVAAFLGAGYRTPLAAVVFVAEATGHPGFIVPGLMASVASQLMMGNASVSPFQIAGRRGHLERRFLLPLTSVIQSDVLTVPPDVSLREFYEFHLLFTRRPSVAVLDGEQYRGVISSDHLHSYSPDDWSFITVADALDAQWPTAEPGWTVEMALREMDRAGVDMLPVRDTSGAFVGITTISDIVQLDEILHSQDG